MLNKRVNIMREEFEDWYIKTYLAIRVGAEDNVIKLRNDSGGYDDSHINGHWEAYKFRREWASSFDNYFDFSVNLQRLYSIFLVVFVIGVTAALYWIAFSPSFYEFVMSFCEVCNA